MSTIRGGDVGVSLGSAITGAYTFDEGGVVYDPSAFVASVLLAHAAAMEVREPTVDLDTNEIGGKKFTPGTYHSGSTINFASDTVVTCFGR
jgi:hypothetical protein